VRERYVVSAPVAGRVQRVTLKAGDAVAAGAPVALLVPNAPALLDSRTARELTERVGAAEAELDRARAATERAEAALGLARSELERQRVLAEKGFASRQGLDRAERELEVREKEAADEHGASHQLALARTAASTASAPGSSRGSPRIELRAPVAGRVLRVLQQSESAVAAGAPILELGDPDDLEVIADVLTTDAVGIPAGAPVELVRSRDSAPLQGRVRLVEPGGFTKVSALGVEEQRVYVVMEFAPSGTRPQGLGDAYRLDARILLDARERALVLPVAALFRHAGGYAVFVAEQGRARVRPVDVASRATDTAAIAKGIGAGERVIVYPPDTLRDGGRVRERNASR
jgi:HlyD family secretion protein